MSLQFSKSFANCRRQYSVARQRSRPCQRECCTFLVRQLVSFSRAVGVHFEGAILGTAQGCSPADHLL